MGTREAVGIPEEWLRAAAVIAHYAADTPDTPALFRRDCPYRRVRSGRSQLQARSIRSVCHYGRVVGGPTPLLSCYKPGRVAATKTAIGTSPSTRHTTSTHGEYLPIGGLKYSSNGQYASTPMREPPTAPDACPQEARSGMASTVGTSGRRMRPLSPRPPFTARPPRLRAAPGRPRGGHRGGAEDRSDLCAHHRCKGYGVRERRKRKNRRAVWRGKVYAAYGAFSDGVREGLAMTGDDPITAGQAVKSTEALLRDARAVRRRRSTSLGHRAGHRGPGAPRDRRPPRRL